MMTPSASASRNGRLDNFCPVLDMKNNGRIEQGLVCRLLAPYFGLCPLQNKAREE